MAKLDVVKYGSDTLRKHCASVTKFDKDLKKLINNMLETMYATDGVGLAAPQVGVNKRVLVIDVDYTADTDTEDNEDTGEYNPYIMINPVIVYKEGEMDSYEGCLSFPGVFINVKRARKILVKYLDESGKEVRLEAEGDLFCRCIQHEIDHLDGKLFVDIALDKSLVREELVKNGMGGVKSEPPLLFN